MYYRRLKFCITYLALNRGYFEAVLMKNTPGPLGINNDLLRGPEGYLNTCSRILCHHRNEGSSNFRKAYKVFMACPPF
jgi:hypothetical protein